MHNRFNYSPYQEKIFEWVVNGTGDAVVQAVAGSGKCLGIGTPVLMYDGSIKPVEQIVVGDLLMGDDSTPRRVLSTTSGKDTLYKIKPTRGEAWVCNSSHILSLTTAYPFLTLKSGCTIKAFDVVDLPLIEFLKQLDWIKKKGLKQYRVGVNFVNSQELPINPRFAGCWLADGTRNATCVEIADGNESVLSYVRSYFDSIGLNYKEYFRESRTIIRLSKGGNWFREKLYSLFSPNNDKRIPHLYLTASETDRLTLLAGFLDGDGYSQDGLYCAVTKFEPLKNDLLYLARSLGFAAYAKQFLATTGYGKGNEYWRISISGDIERIPSLYRKVAIRKSKRNVLFTSIQVEKLGIGDYYGFEIDGNRRFLLGDFTVTHNTSTLVEAAKLISSDKAMFIAFNRHIVAELQQRLGNRMTVKTVHSIGCSAVRSHLGRIIVDDAKYADIAKPYAQEIADDLSRDYRERCRRSRNDDDENKPQEPPSASQVLSQLKSLAHFCRVTLTPPDKYDLLEEMVDHFGCLDLDIPLKQLQYPLVEILRLGEQVAIESGNIDYDDMLWLPYRWDLFPPKSGFLLVDEAQDINPAQLDLILKMRAKGGRTIWVGDKFQAIYGFSGAMNDSLDRIIATTRAITLPLSICYRCPVSHIKLAQEIVPSIEASISAISGTVEYIPYEKVHETVLSGDLVIARCTAPVVKLCIELIQRRISARVRGKDIGKSLTAIVKDVAKMPNYSWANFGKRLEEYKNTRIYKLLQKKGGEAQAESLRDRIQGIWVCYTSFNARSMEQLCAEIEDLFSDNRGVVVLSTIHRAKGLEENRVFILRPDQLPLKWKGQQPWMLDQEFCLKYVSLTRAKKALFFVDDEKPMLKSEKPEPEKDSDFDEDEDGMIYF